jgi:hypothetical protein
MIGHVEPPKPSLDSMRWPFINLEDLSTSKCLLLYLNARARNAPSTFALSELDFSPYASIAPQDTEDFINLIRQTLPGRSSGQHNAVDDRTHKQLFRSVAARLASMRIYFSCDVTAQSYGKLVHCDGLTETEQEAAKFLTMLLVRGLIVLRCQSGILSLLVSCCRYILHDMTEEHMVMSSVQTEPPNGELFPRVVNGHVVFSDYVMISPYRPRGSIDFERLLRYVGSTLDVTKDHAWALREDPSYFADHMMEIINHRTEMVPDKSGRVHYEVDTPSFMDLVLKDIIIKAYTLPVLWHGFFRKLLGIRELFESGFTLEEQIKHMADFRAFTKLLRGSLTGRIKKLWIPSPNIRERYVRLESTANESVIGTKPYKIRSLGQIQIYKLIERQFFVESYRQSDAALYT